MKEAILLKANETQEKITPRNGNDFALDELYALIGCDLIEVVHASVSMYGEHGILICDEEALLKDKPLLNIGASNVAGFPIFGNAILCASSMLK